ncbi:MAG TPA: hypothetical protein VMF66_17400 [Candidatus Acidoferrum sp.]|nr:hypothetical protein [Candidatus Acidoferrum sp.]
MEGEIRLDEVSVFGGKLSFLIPYEWEELESEADNVYVYSRPRTDSGWLRVSLNTSTVVAVTPSEKLKGIFEKRENASRDEQTGNLVHAYERDSEEEGVKIHLYYWIVANAVEPNLVREAVFSYTVLSERINDEETVATVGLLRQIVGQANFNSETQRPDWRG